MEAINFRSVDEILEFAIEQEQQTEDLYLDMASKASKAELKELWEQLAHDEQAHKQNMQNVLASLRNGENTCCSEHVKLSEIEYMSIPIRNFSEKEEILVSAIRQDLEKIEYYKHWATKTADVKCANLLLHIAKQELVHKKSLLHELNMTSFY